MHAQTQPPKHRVGDIFRARGAEYAYLRGTTPQQRRTLDALAACRTEELGGYVASCDVCDYRRVVYNPCRNRHCPSCEGQLAEAWTRELLQRLLPCRYFHVVFTLPGDLRSLAFQNAKLVYGLMLKLAGRALLRVARLPKHLGAQLGVTTVLHTWTQDLRYHPHVHCIVTAGGLSPDGSCWKRSWGEHYLAPNRLLGARYRRSLLRSLAHAYRTGKLRFAGGCESLADPNAFLQLRRRLEAKRWNVYAKAAFADVSRLVRYFGRYMRRIAISDRRLLEADYDSVRFATKDGGEVWLDTLDFIHRFLLHVLPHGFVKVRHYGLHASACRRRLERARALLGGDSEPDESATLDPEEDAQERCPQCFFGLLRREELWSQPRDYPLIPKRVPP